MTDARRVFDHMSGRNMDSWHLMINGSANNDLGDEGLLLFEQMKKLGLEPTGETFFCCFVCLCKCLGSGGRVFIF
ncbi:hypothetical protein NC652_001901 [Populus alba x Populus x berolinensis]|nr:hypothetical protein NC652_001901 [Populus alba x Populus x berolinensis]